MQRKGVTLFWAGNVKWVWKDRGKINASGKIKFWKYRENIFILEDDKSSGPNAYHSVQIQQ